MEHLLGAYPIMIDGERAGELRVERDGLMARFDASMPDMGGVIRLSVYGGGVEGYLGVMIPDTGRLRLVKRLSRAAAGAFPQKIEYAAVAGGGAPAVQASVQAGGEASEAVAAESDEAVETAQGESVEALEAALTEPNEAVEAAALNGTQEGDVYWTPEPNPWSIFAEQEMKTAWENVTGALKSGDNDILLVALPTSEAEKIKGVYITASGKRMIEDTEYIIFKVDSGVII